MKHIPTSGQLINVIYCGILTLSGTICSYDCLLHCSPKTRWSSLRPLLHSLVCGVDLNDERTTIDLLEKRSAIYSSRPPSVTVDLCGWGWDFAFMPYGALWNAHRRVLAPHLRRESIAVFDEYQATSAHKLLQRLLESPDELVDHVRLYVLRSYVYLLRHEQLGRALTSRTCT